MFWAIFLPIVWLVGAIVFYSLDGYFKFDFIHRYRRYGYDHVDNYIYLATIFWFAAIWVVLAKKTRSSMEEARKRVDEKKEVFQRIRVAKAKELEAIQKKAEQELAKYMSELEEDSKQKQASL